MKAAWAALALALPQAAVAQDCAVLHEAALGLIETGGFAVEAPGELSPGEPCVLTGLAVSQPPPGGVRVEVARLEWQASGLDPAGMLGAAAALDLQASGVRWHALTGTPQFDYMLRMQARRNLVDARLSASWDPATAVLEVAEAHLDLPGRNHVTLRLRLSALHVANLILHGASGALVALDTLELDVRHTGYFDGFLTGYLATSLGDDAAAEVARLQAEAAALLAQLPEAAFPADTKSALGAVIDEAPVPWGRLKLTVAPDAPLPLVPFMMSLYRAPRDPATLTQAFPGVQVTAEFEPWEGWTE